MSALGQKQTYAAHNLMSALPPKADMRVAQGMSALGQKRTLLYSLRHLCGQPNAARRMDKPA